MFAAHPGIYILLFFHFTLLLLDRFPEVNSLLLPPAASRFLPGIWPSERRSKLHLQQPTVPLAKFYSLLVGSQHSSGIRQRDLQEGEAAPLRAGV